MSDVTGFPLSPQQAQWWRYRDSQQAPIYLQIAVNKVLDIESLKARLEAQLANEEILRTRLQRISGMEYPLQVIDDTSESSLLEKDWRSLSKEKAEQYLNNLIDARAEFLTAYWIALPESDQGPHFILHLAAPGWMLDPASLQLLAQRILGLQDIPEEPLQYVDYSEWKQELLAEGSSHPAMAFWQENTIKDTPMLGLENTSVLGADNISTLGLAGIRDSGYNQNRPLRFAFSLPESNLLALEAIAHQQDIPLSSLLQGTWQALLTRLSQPDTTPAIWYEEGRNDDTFDALGVYGQPLSSQHTLQLEQALTPQLKPLVDNLLLASGWQDYFPGLQAKGLSVFAWLPIAEAFQQDEFSWHSNGGISAPASLQLLCMPQAKGHLACQFIADSERYNHNALVYLAEQWQQVLTSVIAASEKNVSRISLLGEQQRLEITPIMALSTQAPSFLERWQDTVFQYPERVAVRSRTASLTYQGLNNRANQLARYLISQGINSGDIVGIHLPRGIDAILAILATLKAGAAYLPLDPDYPDERLGYMVQDSGVNHVIGYQKTALQEGLTYLLLHSELAQSEETTELTRLPEKDDTAYLIYTSGSVGQPKAVEISHDNLAHSLTARHRYYSDPVSAYLMLSSLSFDSSVAGIFWALSQGGELVLPDNGDERDIQALLDLITRFKVSHGLSLPSIYNAMIDGANASQREVLQQSLNLWIVAGEACPEALIQKHYQSFPKADLVNEYGPTEATVWASATVLKPDQPVTIGQPVPGMGVYLLNTHNEPVAIGETGEIYLTGPQLAKGYKGKPKQTAEAFVIYPNIAGDQRLYRTGDLARWRSNGELQFLGRRDHQVKIRGHRIELAEIENRLSGHESVKQAAVIAKASGDTQRLVAYIIEAGNDVDLDVLRNHLTITLPDYMVPSDFVVISHFPLTPNGKLDIKALPEPSNQSGMPYIPPSNEIEETLARIIEELLDRPKIGIDDNFFHIGGDSILSLQVVSRALSQGVSVSARDIFEQKTIAKIALKASIQKDTAQASQEPGSQEEGQPLISLDDDELDALIDELDSALS